MKNFIQKRSRERWEKHKMNIHNKRHMQCPFCSDPLVPTVLMQPMQRPNANGQLERERETYKYMECGFLANFDKAQKT
jgi:hypothetical protein